MYNFIYLAEIGVSTFKVLLNALSDDNENVRKIVEKQILEKFSLGSLVNFYYDSPSKASLVITMKSILDKNHKINPKLITLLKDLHTCLSKKEKDTLFSNEDRILNSTTENEKYNQKLAENDLLIENNDLEEII